MHTHTHSHPEEIHNFNAAYFVPLYINCDRKHKFPYYTVWATDLKLIYLFSFKFSVMGMPVFLFFHCLICPIFIFKLRYMKFKD